MGPIDEALEDNVQLFVMIELLQRFYKFIGEDT